MSESKRLPVVALVGRPNVGKSTLFNRYAGSRRALVADQPGLTRDRIAERIEVEGRMIWLVDTAGLDPVRGEGLEAAVQAQARSAVENADVILFVVDGKTDEFAVFECGSTSHVRRTDRAWLAAAAAVILMAAPILLPIILTAGFAMFPFIMPSSTDPNSSLIAWDAVSSHLTLTVMFWAAMIFVPIILAFFVVYGLFSGWAYARTGHPFCAGLANAVAPLSFHSD